MDQVQEQTAVVQFLQAREVDGHVAEVREGDAVEVAWVREQELVGCWAEVDWDG